MYINRLTNTIVCTVYTLGKIYISMQCNKIHCIYRGYAYTTGYHRHIHILCTNISFQIYYNVIIIHNVCITHPSIELDLVKQHTKQTSIHLVYTINVRLHQWCAFSIENEKDLEWKPIQVCNTHTVAHCNDCVYQLSPTHNEW